MSSHIRVGTFEYVRHHGEISEQTQFLEYVIKRHYPNIQESENKALRLIEEVIKKQIDLVVQWSRVGFIHGVMNTDNTSIAGETFDYGPCAFMNTYHPDTVFSSIDTQGRYRFGNQPNIILWNLSVFASALLPLIDPNIDVAIEKAKEVLNRFHDQYDQKWLVMMSNKFGISNSKSEDGLWISEALTWMKDQKVDYTQAFIDLSLGDDFFIQKYHAEAQWLNHRKERIEEEYGNDFTTIQTIMQKNNPAFIPRNYMVESALDNAELGNMEEFYELVNKVSSPYCYDDIKDYTLDIPKGFDQMYQTFCGT